MYLRNGSPLYFSTVFACFSQYSRVVVALLLIRYTKKKQERKQANKTKIYEQVVFNASFGLFLFVAHQLNRNRRKSIRRRETVKVNYHWMRVLFDYELNQIRPH